MAGSLDGIELYATDHGERRTVAIIADQYLRLAPYKGLVEALKEAGRNLALPPISDAETDRAGSARHRGGNGAGVIVAAQTWPHPRFVPHR